MPLNSAASFLHCSRLLQGHGGRVGCWTVVFGGIALSRNISRPESLAIGRAHLRRTSFGNSPVVSRRTQDLSIIDLVLIIQRIPVR